MYLYILYSGLSFIFRWDINNIDHIPEYMKLFYVVLLDVYNEIEEEMEKQGYHYRLHYAIEAVGGWGGCHGAAAKAKTNTLFKSIFGNL